MRASLIRAMDMAKKMEYVFLTTANKTASPHLSIVQPINIDDHDRLKLMGWFCQYTLENLQETKVEKCLFI